jgi:hypothetical protein
MCLIRGSIEDTWHAYEAVAVFFSEAFAALSILKMMQQFEDCI